MSISKYNPGATKESEFRKLLKFAKASAKDVFYDLGSGYGTPCIVAAEHYKMKKVIGIEVCGRFYLKAVRRIMRERLTAQIWLWYGYIEEMDFSDATLAYCTLTANLEIIEILEKMLRSPCKLITPNSPLPSIKPVDDLEIKGEKFYLMKAPLRKYKAKNPDDWVRSFGYRDFKHYYSELDTKDRRWIKNIMRQIYGKNCLSRP